jgi:hypothetical protein
VKIKAAILFIFISLLSRPGISWAQDREDTINFDFCDQPIRFNFNRSFVTAAPTEFSAQTIYSFYDKVNKSGYDQVIQALLLYKETYRPDDWLFYQLIRKTAQHISPKADNYFRYTLYKWFLLCKTGYDAKLAISGNRVLFYVRCDENIYNIPTRMENGKQYVCLNYHDYGSIDFLKERFAMVDLPVPEAQQVFSYKITHLPEFKPSDYKERELSFNYNESDYHFKVKLNPQIQALFTNYPVVDYELFLNIPLSNETYQSLIPLLKKSVKHMSVKSGVDYLMRFTRYAFLFQPDAEHFGSEKRLSPEQTLLYDKSDCEDRVALFFYLVREIYDLPMIVLNYPNHVTIAVQFEKPVGNPIVYNGNKYSVCEPTPQKNDLPIGRLLPGLNHVTYEVAYVYTPKK